MVVAGLSKLKRSISYGRWSCATPKKMDGSGDGFKEAQRAEERTQQSARKRGMIKEGGGALERCCFVRERTDLTKQKWMGVRLS
jgi:hypothetical protein